MRVLEAPTRVAAEAGTDLRQLVDRLYHAADGAGVRIAHTDPELTALLHDRLVDRLDGRRLTGSVEVGLTADGAVVVFPAGEAVEQPDPDARSNHERLRG